MRISHKHKFVFLSLPRAASLTVRKILNPYSDIKSKRKSEVGEKFPFWHHTKAGNAKKIFEQKGWDWEDYSVFCFVRNPYDRVVSAYKRRWKETYGWHSTGRPVRDIRSFLRDILLGPISFEEFVRENSPEEGYTISIYNFTHDNKNRCMVDDVLKFENLPNNLIDYANENLGVRLNRSKIGHYHKSDRNKNYKCFYTDETKEIIRNQYKMELEEFGYEF